MKKHLTTQFVGQNSDVYIDRSVVPACDAHFDSLVKDGGVYTLRSEPQTGQIKCYNSIYFGVTGMSYVDGDVDYLSSSEFPTDAKAFRTLFYDRALVARTQIGKDRLVIMQKKTGEHLVSIENLNQLVEAATERFGNLQVIVVSWDDYTIKEMIQLMRRTKMMVSLPGSDIMNAIFMRDNSFLVIYCRYVNGVKEGSNEVRLWYKYLAHLTTFEFCVDHVDVHLTETNNVWVNVSRLKEFSTQKKKNGKLNFRANHVPYVTKRVAVQLQISKRTSPAWHPTSPVWLKP